MGTGAFIAHLQDKQPRERVFPPLSGFEGSKGELEKHTYTTMGHPSISLWSFSCFSHQSTVQKGDHLTDLHSQERVFYSIGGLKEEHGSGLHAPANSHCMQCCVVLFEMLDAYLPLSIMLMSSSLLSGVCSLAHL